MNPGLRPKDDRAILHICENNPIHCMKPNRNVKMNDILIYCKEIITNKKICNETRGEIKFYIEKLHLHERVFFMCTNCH